MKRRSYGGSADVGRLQDFNARQIRSHGRTGMLHPGDIPHRIFNALRRDDPHHLVHIWEDNDGEIAAWTLLDPQGGGFDPQISPAVRDAIPALEHELILWSEEALIDLMTRSRSESTSIETEAFVDDAPRTVLLRRLGWVRQGDGPIVLGRRDLGHIRVPELPSGFRLRNVKGLEEAAALADLHSMGFGSTWTPEQYRRVMESPGYDRDREFVAEAPNGELAAFCVVWPDEINRIGLFEPVAVHPDYRRRRLGRAVLRAGMREMKSWGMESAEVMYEVDNPGAGPLYGGEGFALVAEINIFRKPVSLGS